MRLMQARFDEISSNLHDQLSEVYGVGFTSDIRRETMTRRQYIFLTIHHVDINRSKIICRTLACEEIVEKDSNTISQWFRRKLEH